MANATDRTRIEAIALGDARSAMESISGIDRLAAPRRPLASECGWEGPTLAELAERVEHQFGKAPGLSGIFTLGFGRDEPLTPGDIHRVCEHLGLPAEDFGVGS